MRFVESSVIRRFLLASSIVAHTTRCFKINHKHTRTHARTHCYSYYSRLHTPLRRRASRPRRRPRRSSRGSLLLLLLRLLPVPALPLLLPRLSSDPRRRSPRHGIPRVHVPRRHAHDARHRDAPRERAHRLSEITTREPSSRVRDDGTDRERHLRSAFRRALALKIHRSHRVGCSGARVARCDDRMRSRCTRCDACMHA